MSCPSCGWARTIASASGRRKCLGPEHVGARTYNADREPITEALEAKSGHAPAHDMVHTVPPGFEVKGVSTAYRPDGSIAYQWVKSRIDPEQQAAIMAAAFRGMAEDLPRVEPRPARGNYMAELLTGYPIGDPHFGMRAWAAETGDDWDLAIAEQVHCGAMAALVAAAPPTEQAVIVNLGDALHYDSMEAKTPRSGHFLDADGRYAKMVRVWLKVIRQCIESALEKHQRVHVINVQGNHDETGAIWTSVALSAIYEREPRVTVETSPSLFSYYRFGKVLIGAHHGHTCKAANLPSVMAADRPDDWGQTRHRYWWTGHIHHESVKEFPGVSVESFNTLASKDAYATAGGWRSRETMQAIVLHVEHGEVARSKVNAAMFRSVA
jgi:UDP-2,3-diacylglucosamine pyrophosphatase LpxH